MSGFGEDKAHSQVNEALLEKEFHIDTAERRRQDMQEITNMRNQLQTSLANSDPDTILVDNIERANNLLDRAEAAIMNGGETNARMYEVCAQLINAITSASVSIQNSSFGNQKHEYNMRLLAVKEGELAVKKALAGEKGEKSSDKVIVMDRESLLKMINKEDKEVVVKSEFESKK